MNVDVFYSKASIVSIKKQTQENKVKYIFSVKKNGRGIYLRIIFVEDFTNNFLNHIFQGYYLIPLKK